MESGFKKFAGWVLSFNFLLLAGVVIVVAVATHLVYSSARRQALEQVRLRQELLAAQASRGISEFYRGLLDDLDVLARSGEAATLAPIVWETLRGRVTRLAEIDLGTGQVVWQYQDEGRSELPPVVTESLGWLRSVAGPSVGAVLRDSGAYTTLAAARVQPDQPRVVVVVVPVRSVETRFLNDLKQPDNMGAMLADHGLRVISAEQQDSIGAVLTGEGIDPRIRAVAEKSMRDGQRTTSDFLEAATVNDVRLEPMMVTIQPVELPDGTHWWLGVSSDLSQVHAAVQRFFRRTVIGGGLVVAAVTAILVSSTTQVIRDRLKLERFRREVLSRELDQAREIQLSWLPERQDAAVSLDIAGVNRPASHVSGDFYNWFELPDGRVCTVIGDVTGHGLPAAFLMATTQLLVRAVITRLPDPGRCLTEVNRLLCEHVFSGQFVTLLVLVIDPATNQVELATSGHPPPLVGSGEAFEFLPVEPELVLAIEPSTAYGTQRFDLPARATIVLYTDGVTDVQSPEGARAGDAWLAGSIIGSFGSAGDVVHAIMDAIDAYRGGREPSDDLTLCVIQLQPRPGGQSTASPQTLAAS